MLRFVYKSKIFQPVIILKQMKAIIICFLLIAFVSSSILPSSFTLTFQYAARQSLPFDTSQISVLWNNNIISTVVPTDYNLNTVTLNVNVNVGANVLTFAGAGKADGLGAGISSISLTRQGTTTNILVNGDFSQPNLGSGWGIFINIAGWTGSEIQIGRGTIYNSAWPGQVCELDGNVNDEISQTFTFDSSYNQIANVAPTLNYTLEFDWAPRTNGISNLESSQANIFLNGALVANLVSVVANTGVNHFSRSVTLLECDNVLQIDGTGLSDSFGISISNVKLYSAVNSTNAITNGDFTQPILAFGTWEYVNGGIPGWTAAVGQVGYCPIYNSAWTKGQCIELDSSSNTRYIQVIDL